MRRSERLSRGLRLEAWTASDVARQQLGWYLRNCALSPAAGMLEPVMLQRLDRLKGAVEETSRTSNSMTMPRSMPGTWAVGGRSSGAFSRNIPPCPRTMTARS